MASLLATFRDTQCYYYHQQRGMVVTYRFLTMDGV